MARPTSLAAILLAASGLGGCALFELATDERPSGAQRDAIGDLFDQTATIATTLDDPSDATEGDLEAMLSFDHLVFLVAPDLDASRSAARVAPPAALDCITDDGAGTMTATACPVTLGDGRTCIVDGELTRTAAGAGNRYAGSAAMSGEGCPVSSLEVDVVLEGPSDDPTSLTGTLDVSTADGTTSFTGTAELDLALSGDCAVPSTGTIVVTASGTYAGSPFDGSVTLAFHEEPECGYVTIE
jgi:hypothetical protein